MTVQYSLVFVLQLGHPVMLRLSSAVVYELSEASETTSFESSSLHYKPSCFLSIISPLIALFCPVSAGNKTVPAPPGTSLSHQHLPGRWHPHVVPVARAERLH